MAAYGQLTAAAGIHQVRLAGKTVLVVAGLDERFDWSLELAPAIHLTGLALFVLGQGLFSWVMASNKYFSTVVRIQVQR